MKVTVLFCIIALTPCAVTYGQQQPVSRYGMVEIKDDDDRLKHRLLIDGKEVFQYEGESIQIVDVLKGTGVDYLVVGAYSGGIACPMQVVIVEVNKSGEHNVSKEFGACTEPTKTTLVNGRVTMQMPSHIPHPELLSKKELRTRQRTTEIYTWYKGKLTKKLLTR